MPCLDLSNSSHYQGNKEHTIMGKQAYQLVDDDFSRKRQTNSMLSLYPNLRVGEDYYGSAARQSL